MSSEEAALAQACRLVSISAWANQLAGVDGSHMHKYSIARRRASTTHECDALQQQAQSRTSVKLKYVNTASCKSNGSSMIGMMACGFGTSYLGLGLYYSSFQLSSGHHRKPL
jgi:hypothetical protein